MAEKKQIAQLEQGVNELTVTSDNQDYSSNPCGKLNQEKKQNHEEKVLPDQSNHEDAEEGSCDPENITNNSDIKEPSRKPRRTKEYIAWQREKKRLSKKGTWSSFYLHPRPKQFLDEDYINIKLKSKKPSSSVKTPEVSEPNTLANETSEPLDQNVETGACQQNEPSEKMTILKKESENSELEPDAQQAPLLHEESSQSSKVSDIVVQAASSSDLKNVQKNNSKPKPNVQKQPDERPTIPEGCIQLVVKWQPPPKPKKKPIKAKPAEKTEEAEKERGESPQMSNEEGAVDERGPKSPKASSEGEEAEEERAKSPQTSSEEEIVKPSSKRDLKVIVRKKDLERFRRSGVLPLKHINERFPRAFFQCRLCKMHLSSLSETERHLKDKRHVRLQSIEQKKQTASLMPMPTAEVTEAVGEFVQGLYECSRIDQNELEIRLAAFNLLQKTIEEVFPGYSIRLYGSIFTGFGMKHSDVNVSLVHAEPKDEPVSGLMIINIFNMLLTNPIWTDIVEDFNCRVPIIRFTHKQLKVAFSLVIDGENAYKTSVLLTEYQRLDARFAVMAVAFKAFARICHLDQPDYGSLPPHAFTLMVLYYLQQVKVLPVLHTSLESDSYKTADEIIQSGKWKPTEKTLGSLWLGMLQFYACKFLYQERVVCVRSLKPMQRSVKNWGSRRLTIEDPFQTNINVALSMTNAHTFDFFLECMGNLFIFFWIPHTASGPLFTQLVLPGEGADAEGLVLTPYEAKQKMSELKKEDFKWDFSPAKILGSKQLPLSCSVCNADGHSKHTCQELKVQSAGPIAQPDLNYLAVLNQICFNIFRNFSQSRKHIDIRECIRYELEQYIQREYPDAVLTLFGSSCNGFGFFDSDMDVCMTFRSNPDGKDVDFGAVIKRLGKILRKNRSFAEIVPITNAKVPIVKMRHRASRLEADISLYNTLGRRNSALLATYASIDPRVRILGYLAKLLAKQCDIGDASRGTLSSYAYTLMVIFYLQQINPPVLPVLQEIVVEGVDRSAYIVEGRDTWFFEDLPNLHRVWPHCGGNIESAAVLWLGFLRFYGEIFNYERQVICIRQSKPLFRLEKMWTERFVAIEDPFDLSHNLGSALSFRTGAYIRKVFLTALKVFSTPLRTLPRGYNCAEEYLFNPEVLKPGTVPPNDRGCNICGRIGHKVRDCDKNKSNRNRKQESDNSGDEAKGRGKPVAQQGASQVAKKQPVAPARQQAAHRPNPRQFHGPPARYAGQPAQYAPRQRSAPQYARAGPRNQAAPPPPSAP